MTPFRTAAVSFFALFLSALLSAMQPPAMSVQVSPSSPLRGLGTASDDGLGVYWTARHRVRDSLQRGGRNVSNPNDERSESFQTTLLLDYRLAPDWSAALAVPHIRTEGTFTDPNSGLRVTHRTSGLGDVALFGRWSVWKDRPLTPNKEWLAIFGVEFPTGSTNEKDDAGAPLAATEQLGSKTTDLIFGAALVWGSPALSFYGDAAYKMNGSRAYTFGNMLSLNAGVNIPLVSDRWALLGELNGEFLGRDRSDLVGALGRNADGSVQNTGGEAVFFSPALQWRFRHGLSLTAGAQFPLYQNFRGVQLKSDPTFSLAFYSRFGGRY